MKEHQQLPMFDISMKQQLSRRDDQTANKQLVEIGETVG
jgi:hypothetical protein